MCEEIKKKKKKKKKSVNKFSKLTELAASRAFLLEAYVGVSVCMK